MFVTDEFGAKKSKTYDTLTTKELHMLVESLCVRLNLFNQKYPAFLPQVVLALMQHPNLARSDKSHLDTYCTLFELDWRGDRHISNRDEFMATNPIYTQDSASASHLNMYTAEYVSERLERAGTPFLDGLVGKISEQAK